MVPALPITATLQQNCPRPASSRRRRSALKLSALLPLALLTACGLFDNSKSSSGGRPADLSGMVFVGDSLSAGYQNDSLLDTQQPHGFASLIAAQAKSSITLPLIAPPGAPAVLELVSVGPPPVVKSVGGVTTGRDNPTTQPTDLAVPGHKVNDLINTVPVAVPTTNQEIITDLVLGFPVGNNKSQLQKAIALKPTILFIWIGNNDALVADTSGTPASMTPSADFSQQFTQMLTTLHTQTKATLLVANIPDVTAIPYLTPAATVIAEASASSGLSTTQVTALLGIQPGDFVNATGLGEVQNILKAAQAGQAAGPIDDAGVLTAAEVQQVQAQLALYNQVIAQETAAVGATLVDISGLYAKLKSGITINGYGAGTGFLGGIFSLDGIHPTNTGYALIANQFIDTMNTALKTGLPDVDVSAVAATDPLFGPNIKPTVSAVSIPLAAARAADRLISGRSLPASQEVP